MRRQQPLDCHSPFRAHPPEDLGPTAWPSALPTCWQAPPLLHTHRSSVRTLGLFPPALQNWTLKTQHGLQCPGTKKASTPPCGLLLASQRPLQLLLLLFTQRQAGRASCVGPQGILHLGRASCTSRPRILFLKARHPALWRRRASCSSKRGVAIHTHALGNWETSWGTNRAEARNAKPARHPRAPAVARETGTRRSKVSESEPDGPSRPRRPRVRRKAPCQTTTARVGRVSDGGHARRSADAELT